MKCVRFMMLMPWGRVGSNLLFAILRQSAPMKLANENLIQLRTAPEQMSWFKEFYELDAEFPSRPHIGSKQNLRAIRDLDALQRALTENNVRVVRLRRKNFAKAAISQIRAEIYAKQTEQETGVAAWGVKRGAKTLGPTVIDPDLLLRRIGIMVEYDSKLMNAFAAPDVLDIEYEEINGSLDGVVTRLRDFLEIPQKAFSPPFDKATPDRLADAVTNFPEIQARLAGTPYISLLVE